MIKPVLSDSELWQAIKLDDKKAFDMLFERYWSVMYTSAYNYLRDSELSAEIVHDIFLNIWQKRKDFQITSLKNYLTSSTRYHVYKSLKARKASAIVYVENYDDEISIKQENEGEEKLNSISMESAIQEYLLQLPKRCREIFLLSRMQNMTNDEIAAHFNISKRTVENQITVALKFLRGHLKEIALLFLINIFK
jgi:RNA polymerase sigma-70 factor (ECF subfamily)